MKTKIQILEETFNYYNEDPSRRAKSDGRCQYLDGEGRMCAFGRCEINPPLTDGSSDAVVNRFDNEEDMNASLKEEYRGHSIEFWVDVQDLHDEDCYWNDESVSDYGVKRYQKLLQKWTH